MGSKSNRKRDEQFFPTQRANFAEANFALDELRRNIRQCIPLSQTDIAGYSPKTDNRHPPSDNKKTKVGLNFALKSQ